MVGQNLYAAAHQHKDAEEIDEMVDPQPEGKSERLQLHPFPPYGIR
jgi:hypothetical protein